MYSAGTRACLFSMAQKWVNSCVCLTTVSGVQAETEGHDGLALTLGMVLVGFSDLHTYY